MKDVWVLVLAAGASVRFGGIKVLAPWGNGTLLSQALATAAAIAGLRVMVVTGGHADLLQPHMRNCLTVFNADWAEGRGASVAAGVQAILQQAPDTATIVILAADQPLVTAAHIEELIAAAVAQDRCALTAGSEASGPPAAIPRRFFPLLSGLTGDQGLKAHLQAQDFVTIRAPEQMRDVDTPEELEFLRAFSA